MTRRQVLVAALTASGVSFAIGAGVLTRDWISCTESTGGRACADPRDKAAGAWAALGVNAMALATNILDDEP
jgi:hypothetical protein